MNAIVNFLFEAGMLKKTPRTGYQFLGSGSESVAAHSFRMALIGYTLAHQDPDADPFKTILICLFHDLHEARTGDHNYVNKRYVSVDESKAVQDLARNLPFGKDIIALTQEFNNGESRESRLAQDADQLDLILELKEQLDLGNKYAREWLDYALQRLSTQIAKKLADEILQTDSTDWWFEKQSSLWVNGSNNQHKPKKR